MFLIAFLKFYDFIKHIKKKKELKKLLVEKEYNKKLVFLKIL